MFKQLKNYYLIVSLPFVMLLSGAAYFSNAIKSTIIRNPHPQINYVIFYIILFGGTLILLSVYRLMKEAKNIKEYSEALQNNADVSTLQAIANKYTGDIATIIQMLAASSGRPISHQEQAAIEHEMNNTRARIVRRNALPQYLSGLLVGMGLLGTFVGLLSTLSDIGILISSFADLDMATASPLLVFRTMIERMKAPMQSMSIAFSASMFGLLGSIILGLMMLGVRRFQGDISSLLGSKVARHIELALSYETPTTETANRTTSAAFTATPPILSNEDSKILARIEERLAESARIQQRTLSAEMEDFQKQRADILRAITEQNEANHKFRFELQEIGRKLESLLSIFDKGAGTIASQVSDLTVGINENTNESQKLLSMQVDEQRKLRETLLSYNMEERLNEILKIHQRTLLSEIDDFQNQRSEMLRTLAEQTEASNHLSSELQQLSALLGSGFSKIEKGNSEVTNQISELMIHLSADAKESQKLLVMQVQEQQRLRETLDWRTGGAAA